MEGSAFAYRSKNRDGNVVSGRCVISHVCEVVGRFPLVGRTMAV